MVFASTRTSCQRFFEIAETAPGDGNVIRGILAVEVSVHAILEIAMIHPDVGGSVNAEVVSPVRVIGSGALEGKIAQYQVVGARFEIEDARGIFGAVGIGEH